jgi:uncharacterized protein (DUF58 family)
VDHWITGDRAEDFISFVASLIYTLHRQGLGVGLWAPGAIIGADRSRGQLKKILTYLALVDPATEQPLGHSTGTRGINALELWQKWSVQL